MVTKLFTTKNSKKQLDITKSSRNERHIQRGPHLAQAKTRAFKNGNGIKNMLVPISSQVPPTLLYVSSYFD